MASRFQNISNNKKTAFGFYIFISALMIALFIDITPFGNPVTFALKPYVKKGLQFTGMWQAWNMFSPNPTREDVTMFAEVTLTSGQKLEWTPVRMAELSLTDRYLKERWRKWGMDNIRSDSHEILWPSLGRYIQSSYETANPGKQIQQINVYREWYVIPKLEERFVARKDIQNEHRRNFKFYTYEPLTHVIPAPNHEKSSQ